MAKKKNKQQTNAGYVAANSKPAKVVIQQKVPGNKAISADAKFSTHALVVAGIVLVTYLFLKTSLNNLFTNWDDPGYIVNDPLIKNISPEGIKNIFSFGGAVMGNYHPLTILSYAIEYSFVRLEPWLYHFDSLAMHLVCTILVYWLANLLTRRPVAAAVTALLFGIHPMHVESVAWAAGRKDVLYGLFYLAACVLYVYTLRAKGSNKWFFYTGVIVLFICSLLAKPVAVSLPLALLLIDYLEGKLFRRYVAKPGDVPVDIKNNISDKLQVSYALLAEKIPFFLIAVAFGIKSIQDQKKFGALGTLDVKFNMLERIALGSYALITYLWKAVVPEGLSCFYDYPLKVNGSLPLTYYIYPLIAVAILVVTWWFASKNKMIVFGLLFFLVNIGLLLQFIPVGGAILADRYTYIPYIGLFFAVGWLISQYVANTANKQLGYVMIASVLVYACWLGYKSNERCKVWYNTITLWSNEIEGHPTVPNAYNNLGFFYFNLFSDSTNPVVKKVYYDSSFMLLNKSIELQPTFVNPYISLGELERTVGHFDVAKKYYYKALSLSSKDEDANAYLGLAIIYAINNNVDSSGFCFRTALKLLPYFPEAHSNYGNFLDMIGKQDSSLIEYGIAIAQNPDMYAPYLNRGREFQRANKCNEAIKDFEKALEINPDNGEVYYARSRCYFQQGNKTLALQDVQKAISLGFTQIDAAYYQQLKVK